MTSERRRTRQGSQATAIAVVVVGALAFGVYGNSLLNGFVYDDNFQVLENPWILDTAHVGDIFGKGVWAFRGTGGNYYRPMMHLVNMFNYRVFGPQPWGFHLTNVVLHAGISVMVFLLACRLLERRPSDSFPISALAAAAVFATHPIHTEAVSWIAGLPDLLYTLFYLSSLWLYIASTVDGRVRFRGRYALSLLSFFLSAISKEPALTLPAVLLAYDLAFLGPRALRQFGELVKRQAPFAGVVCVYLLLRVNALDGFAPARDPGGVTLLQALPNLFPLFLQYLGKLAVPTQLNAFYEFHLVSSWLAPQVIGAAVATLGLLAVMVALAIRGSRPVFFYLVMTVLPLLPALSIWAIPGSKFCERYLYLPVFGFSMLVALAFGSLRRVSSSGAVWSSTALGLILVLYAVSTFQRNAVWRDEYSLWSDTVKKSPGSADVQNNLGAAFGKRGLTDNAIEHYAIALELDPDRADIHDNLGTAYLEKGWHDRAVEHFRTALQLAPRHVSANAHMGDFYDRRGLTALAIEHYQIALQSRPNSSSLHNKLGLSYGKEGRLEEAATQLHQALRLEPDSVAARNNLGIVYARMGLPDQAIEQLQRALLIAPEGVETLRNLSRVYAMKGMEEESRHFQHRAQAAQKQGISGAAPERSAP